MQKISGILPPTARTTSVDIENSQPVRKGVPAFGRRVVGNDSGDRVTMSSIERSEGGKVLKNYKPNDIHNSDIPVRMADAFFINTRKAEQAEKLQAPSMQIGRDTRPAVDSNPGQGFSASAYSTETEDADSPDGLNVYA